MLRHREFLLLLIVTCLACFIAIVCAALISPAAIALVSGLSIILVSIFVLFTHWRYKQLAALTADIRRITSGDFLLDIRDNQEGELSILKSELYKVTQMLSEHRHLLEEHNEQLTDAISDISHQLKTPLTSMMVMVDLLSDAALPETKRKEFTHLVNVQLERIDWLVSSLLKLSKIDAGSIVFKKEKINVQALIQKALQPLLIPMEIKKQTYAITGHESVTCVGDEHWMIEAMINIMKNSVEHMPEGGKLTISAAENALYTEISIADNGRGIAREDLPYIFKRFYKGKQASDGSIGIGLAMAHSIITNQNGTIEVESKEGEGTQFRIKLYKHIV